MRIYDLIAKKRDGGTHTREALEAIVGGFTRGEVADYQMAASVERRRSLTSPLSFMMRSNCSQASKNLVVVSLSSSFGTHTRFFRVFDLVEATVPSESIPDARPA